LKVKSILGIHSPHNAVCLFARGGDEYGFLPKRRKRVSGRAAVIASERTQLNPSTPLGVSRSRYGRWSTGVEAGRYGIWIPWFGLGGGSREEYSRGRGVEKAGDGSVCLGFWSPAIGSGQGDGRALWRGNVRGGLNAAWVLRFLMSGCVCGASSWVVDSGEEVLVGEGMV